MTYDHTETDKLAECRRAASRVWERRCERVISEAGGKCELCPATRGLLVHLTFRLRGLRPWQHPNCLLMCLCRACRRERREVEETILAGVCDVMRDKTTAELREQPVCTFFDMGFTLPRRATS